jgi:hypothetical protein
MTRGAAMAAPVNDGDGWRKWTNQILFTLLILISSGALGLLITSLKTDISHLREIQSIGQAQTSNLLTQQSAKLDDVCKRVSEHDTLLRLPFDQRREFYKIPKLGFGEGVK